VVLPVLQVIPFVYSRRYPCMRLIGLPQATPAGTWLFAMRCAGGRAPGRMKTLVYYALPAIAAHLLRAFLPTCLRRDGLLLAPCRVNGYLPPAGGRRRSALCLCSGGETGLSSCCAAYRYYHRAVPFRITVRVVVVRRNG